MPDRGPSRRAVGLALGASAALLAGGRAAAATLDIGLFSEIGSLDVPPTAGHVQTTGYAAMGIGAARYVAVEAGPATAWRALSRNGRWFALDEPIVTPQMLGASPGDGVTNDRPAFQAWSDYLALSGRKGLCPRHQVRYRFDCTPWLITSHTTLEWEDAEFEPDLTGLGPDPGKAVAAYGALLMLGFPEVGKPSGWRGAYLKGYGACVVDGLSLEDMVQSVTLSGRLRIACRYDGPSLAPGHGFCGVSFQLGHDIDMSALAIEVSGTPNDGFIIQGGNRIRMPQIHAMRCGHKGTRGSNRNGASLIGAVVNGHPDLSTGDVTPNRFRCHDNHDEGFATAGPLTARLADGEARGNGQMGLEAVSAFLPPAGVTHAPDGQKLLHRLQISDIAIDGALAPDLRASLIADRTTGAHAVMAQGPGIGLDTAAEMRVELERVSISNFGLTGASGQYPVAVASQSGGSLRCRDLTMEACSAQHGLIYARADAVDIAAVRASRCSGAGLLVTAGAKSLAVSDLRSDGACSGFGLYLAGQDAEEIDLSDILADGRLAVSAIALRYTGHIGKLRISRLAIPRLNASGAAEHGFIRFLPGSGTIGEMTVEDNDAPAPPGSRYWINTDALRRGAVARYRAHGNRCGSPAMPRGRRTVSKRAALADWDEDDNDLHSPEHRPRKT